MLTVHDRMQKRQRYQLTAPMGQNFDPEFKPELTPKEKLSEYSAETRCSVPK